MKFFLSTLLTGLAGIGISLVAGIPWWGLVVTSFLIATIIPQLPTKAFGSGFLGMLLAWGILAWWIDFQNASLLAKQVASIFPLQGSAAALLMITAVLGGLLGGLAGLAGSYIRLSKNKN